MAHGFSWPRHLGSAEDNWELYDLTKDFSQADNLAASGVLYALGGASGGLALYMDDGHLIYEYNMMVIERYTARSNDKLSPGNHKIEVSTDRQARRSRCGYFNG